MKFKAPQEMFRSFFSYELPKELQPESKIDREIEIKYICMPLYRSIFNSTQAELQATKEYVTELVKEREICASKRLFEAALFFVKKEKLRGVIDYRGLNRTKKPYNVPIPHED